MNRSIPWCIPFYRLLGSLIIVLSLMAQPAIRVLAEDGYNEAGGYWVSDYAFISDLPSSQTNVEQFVNYLLYNGGSYYTFSVGDDDVTQDAFESNNSVDTTDLAFFNGHGGDGYLILRWEMFGNDRVVYDEVHWGDVDLDWIMLHSCDTLASDNTGLKSTSKFAQGLNGMRLICGATTIMWNFTDDGLHVAWRLIDSDAGGPDEALPVSVSWFLGIDDGNPSGVTLRILGEDSGCANDYIWGQGGPYGSSTVDNYFWYYDYTTT